MKKGLEFVLNKRDGLVALNLGLVLLLAKVDSIPEQRSCKRNALMICGSGHVKMIFTLLTKVVALYMQALIVQVGISGL